MTIFILLTVLSGIFFGSWSIVLKKARDSKFENFFLTLTLSVLILVSTLAFVLENGITEQISNASLKSISWGIGGGFFWGLATLSFGYVVKLVGLALAYAIILGLGMLVGTSVTMFLMSGLPSGVNTMTVLYVMAGVLIAVTGAILSSYAGHLRSKTAPIPEKRNFKKGIPACLISGFAGSFFAWGYAGAHEQMSTWSSVFLLVVGFSVVQILFLTFRISMLKNWNAYKNMKQNIIYPLIGSLVFGLAVVFHYASADKVGVALSYPLMMGIQILSGNLWSFVIFREWRDAPRKAKSIQSIALIILIIASILIGKAIGA